MRARLASALLLALAATAAAAQPVRLTAGTITIEGTSNVHGWTCTTTQLTGSGDAAGAATGLTGFSALTVTVPVARIECRNGTMNTKLREALATPNVQFVLSNATVGAARNNRFTVNANGRLTIAGQTRNVQVTAQGQALPNNRFRFTGSVPVTMSQYGVRPPTAMAGTMRVRDNVTVRFDVTLAR